MDITALGFTADAPQDVTLWIAAGNPVFGHMGRTIAFRLEAANGERRAEGQEVFEDVASSQGAILAFVTRNLLPFLPRGSLLLVLTREANVSDPYELGRLQKWRASGELEKKPDWLGLEKARERYGVEVAAGRPASSSPDMALLLELTDRAKGVPKKRQRAPGEPEDDGRFGSPPFDPDQARERAIARDRT